MEAINRYMDDGASYQAQAVLAYLKGRDGIEESWCDAQKRYLADPTLARWENCREQGYIISLRSSGFDKQVNIAFFEHRNSDNICAVKWNQLSMNPLTIDTAKFGDKYKDKWDTDFDVSCGEAFKMAEWIYDELVNFWKEV